MLLKLFRSGWVKFLLSCAIIYTMINQMISGELSAFWFLIMTLSLSYLLISQKTILTNRWNVDDVQRDVEDEDKKAPKDKDDDDHPPMGWA